MATLLSGAMYLRGGFWPTESVGPAKRLCVNEGRYFMLYAPIYCPVEVFYKG